MKRVGIVVAMAEECASLTRRRPRAGETMTLGDGTLLGLCDGTGPQAAHEAATRLLSQGAQALVSWGCSAALDPSLRAGDLIVPERVQCEDRSVLEAAAGWRERLLGRLGGQRVQGGAVLESPVIIDAPPDKRERFHLTGAVALDMESAAVARVAFAGQMPFLAVRSIVDPADVSIPGAVRNAFDAGGKLDLTRLFGGFLSHPADVVGTVALGWRFRKAMGSLRRVRTLAGERLAA